MWRFFIDSIIQGALGTVSVLVSITTSLRLTPDVEKLTVAMCLCVCVCVCSHSIFSVRILRVLDAGVPRVLDISECVHYISVHTACHALTASF